jgi:signal transduction histidine kinase
MSSNPSLPPRRTFGTGLGLWVKQEIVHKHGGELRVRSRTGAGRSGTVFVVFLPDSMAQDAQCA